jgi:superfamily II DNA helicase RecQ
MQFTHSLKGAWFQPLKLVYASENLVSTLEADYASVKIWFQALAFKCNLHRRRYIPVLFVSPERLLNERFLNDLRGVPGGVSLAVVDEAHCVSEWSHNFRPAYHRLVGLFNRPMGGVFLF